MEIFSSCWLLRREWRERGRNVGRSEGRRSYVTVKIRAKKENFAERRARKAEHTQSERWIMSWLVSFLDVPTKFRDLRFHIGFLATGMLSCFQIVKLWQNYAIFPRNVTSTKLTHLNCLFPILFNHRLRYTLHFILGTLLYFTVKYHCHFSFVVNVSSQQYKWILSIRVHI